MMRGAHLVLSAAVALVAATDAAPAAPRGQLSGGVILNGNIPAGNATRRHFSGFVSRFSTGAATQAKPRGQVRSQMMFSMGHIN